MAFTVNAAEKMRIDSSGNVGIGTTSPTELLEVHGDTPVIKLRDTSAYASGTGPSISFQGLDSGSATRAFAQISGLSTSGANEGVLTFSTRQSGSVTEAMRIDSSGFVGIGTTSPEADLHIAKSASVLRGDKTSFKTCYCVWI